MIVWDAVQLQMRQRTWWYLHGVGMTHHLIARPRTAGCTEIRIAFLELLRNSNTFPPPPSKLHADGGLLGLICITVYCFARFTVQWVLATLSLSPIYPASVKEHEFRLASLNVTPSAQCLCPRDIIQRENILNSGLYYKWYIFLSRWIRYNYGNSNAFSNKRS